MKKLFILSLLLLPSIYLFGQDPEVEDLNLSSLNEVQPAPTAAAITKFGNVPVSYFSGQPTISIPLYTLKDKDLTVPISLNYHAGGIQVNERPGWCGQNWSLMAGGVITRTKRELADEQPTFGYLDVNNTYAIYGFNSDDYADYLDPADSSGQAMLDYIYNGRYDTEPDLFNFNFLGQSGKFAFDNEGNIITIPHSNLRIQVQRSSLEITGFRITDAQGFIYTFGGDNGTETTNVASAVRPEPDFNSSWYLTSIATPSGGAIGFVYQSNEIRYYIPPRETKFEEPSGGCSVPVTSPTQEYMIVQEKLLHKVRTRLAEVTFTPEAREDLDGGLRLASVQVKSIENDELLYDYRLSYDYYNSGSTDQRLRLLTVSEVKDQQESCDDYTYYVDYNSDNIAAIGSYSLDHWGFQNGSVGSINSTMIPQFGGNREPNGRSVRGLISKLTYPTGGYTEFDFETHHKETVTEVPNFYNATATYELIPGGTDIYETDTLTINCGAEIGGGDDVSFYYRVNFSIKEQPVAKVLLLQQGQIVKEKFFPTSLDWSACKDDPDCMDEINGTFEIKDLGSGKYTVKIEPLSNVDYAYVNGSYQYCSREVAKTIVAGGARVREMKDITAEDTIRQTFNYYKNSNANIILLNEISAIDYSAPAYQFFNEVGSPCSVVGYSSDNRKTGGQNVGYMQVGVSKVNGSGEKLGETAYHYRHTDINNYGGSVANPVTPRVYRPYLQGVLEKIVVRNANGVPVKHTVYAHEIDTITYARGFKVGRTPKYLFQDGDINIESYTYNQVGYDLKVEWLRMTTEYTVEQKGGVSYKSSSTYAYDNSKLVVRSQTINDSKNGTLLKKFRYPFDIDLGVYAKMDGRNMLETKIGVTTIRDDKVVRDRLLQYQEVPAYTGASFYYLPLKLNVLETEYGIGSQAFTEPAYDEETGGFDFSETYSAAGAYVYDEYGNNLERKDRSETLVSAVYANTYPIATFTNANHNEIAYTDFEAATYGGWIGVEGVDIVSGGGYLDTRGYKGRMKKTFGAPEPDGYMVSFHAKAAGGNSLTVNNEVVNLEPEWKFYSVNINATNSEVVLDASSAFVDNVTIHPAQARLIEAYTFKPLVGVSQKMDANGMVQAYSYDHKNRLKAVKDEEGNILQMHEYCYASSRTLEGEIDFSPASVYAGDQVSFQVTANGNNPADAVYTWSIDGVEYVGQSGVQHTFSQQGTYTAGLTITHPAYEPLQVSKTIRVDELSSATLEVVDEVNEIAGELHVYLRVAPDAESNNMEYQLEYKDAGARSFTVEGTYTSKTFDTIFTNYSTTRSRTLTLRCKVSDGAGNDVYTNEVSVTVPVFEGQF